MLIGSTYLLIASLDTHVLPIVFTVDWGEVNEIRR